MINGKHVSRVSGYAPELPTPFDQNGNVDCAALEALCERQIQEGATALVVCGTTGEAPTLTRAEHYAIICIAVGVAHGRAPVIAGAGSNSTGQAIELARDAEAAGADAVLSVVPYYNKPMQAGICAHFRAIADAVGLPIVVYDVPSPTVCDQARHLSALVARLTGALFSESNPASVKYALSSMKMMSPAVRLPLVELKCDSKAKIDAVLAQVCEGYGHYMIGNAVGNRQRVRPFHRLYHKRNCAVVS
jgi:dihydrodipicolinate synthase/N-acetylneuraminate lyase